jgi:hypothetical protein
VVFVLLIRTLKESISTGFVGATDKTFSKGEELRFGHTFNETQLLAESLRRDTRWAFSSCPLPK